MSKPPRSPIAEATQVFNASPSATSTAPPIAFIPLSLSVSSAELTSSILREHIATSTPSSANACAEANPIPLLPPVSYTHLTLPTKRIV